MRGEVIILLLDIDRGRLAVDMECKLDICELNVLLLEITIHFSVLFLVGKNALRVLINSLEAFISLLLSKSLFHKT